MVSVAQPALRVYGNCRRNQLSRPRTIYHLPFTICHLPSSLGAYLHAIAIAQPGSAGSSRGLTTTQSFKDVIKISRFLTKAYGPLFCFVTFDDEDKVATIFPNHGSFGHQHARSRLALAASGIGQKVDARIHFRTQLLIRILHLYLDLHCRLRTICFRRNLGNETLVPEAGKG